MRLTRARALTPTVLLSAALVLGACGDDEDDATDDTTTTSTADAASGDAPDAREDDGEPAGPTVTVGLVDYAFEDIPTTVEVGTTLTLQNHSESEVHEMVVYPAPDDRSAAELFALPPDEMSGLLAGEPAMVLVAPPGESSFPAVGDGTLTEPGRYVAFCAIPIGADPQEYLEAAQAAQDGPPEVDGGPPHFTSGMHADIVVA